MKNAPSLLAKYCVCFASVIGLSIILMGGNNLAFANEPGLMLAPSSTLTQPRYCFDSNIFSQNFGPTPANSCPPSSPTFFPTASETTEYAPSNTSPNPGFGAYGVTSNPSCFNSVFFNGNDYPGNHGAFLIIDSRDTRYSPATSVYTRSLFQTQLQPGTYELRFWMRNAIPVSPPAYGSKGPDLPECPSVRLKDSNGGAQMGRLVGVDYNNATCPGFPMQPLNNSGPNYGWKELIYLFENVSGAYDNISIIPQISSTYGGADFVLDDIVFNKLKYRVQAPTVTKNLFAYRCGGQSAVFVSLNFDMPNATRVYAWRDQNGTEVARISGNQMPYTLSIPSTGAFPRTYTVTDATDGDCSSEPTSVIIDSGPGDNSLTVCAASNHFLHGPDPNQVYKWYNALGNTLLYTGASYYAPLTLPIQRFLIKAVPASNNTCLSISFGTVTAKISPNLIFYDEINPDIWPNFPGRYSSSSSLATTEYTGIPSSFSSMWYNEVALTNNPGQFSRYWRGLDGISYNTSCNSTPIGTFFLFQSSNNSADQNKAVWRYKLGPLSGRLDARGGPGKAYEVRFLMRSGFDGNYIQCPNIKLSYNNGTIIQGRLISADNDNYTTVSCSSNNPSVNIHAFDYWQKMRYVIDIPASVDLTQYSDVSIGICPATAPASSSSLESILIDRVEVYNFNGENVQPIATLASNFLCEPGNMNIYVDNTVQGNSYEILDATGAVLQPAQYASASGERKTFTVPVTATTNFYIRNATSLGAFPGYNSCPLACTPPATLVTVPVSNPYILSSRPTVISDYRARCGTGSVTFQISNPISGRDYEWLDISGNIVYPTPGTPNPPTGTPAADYYRTFSPTIAVGQTNWYVVRLRGNPAECPALTTTVSGFASSVDNAPIPVVADQTRCGIGYVRFTIASPVVGREYEWYDATGNTILNATDPAAAFPYTSFGTNIGLTTAPGNRTTFYVRLKQTSSDCSTPLQPVYGYVNNVVAPTFNIAASSGAAPYFRGNAIDFALTSPAQADPGQSLTYQWNWGDFSPPLTTAGASVEHVFTRAGTFYVRVVATQTFGNSSPVCSNSATLSITIKEPLCELNVPVAGGFTNNPTTGAITYASIASCVPVYTLECLGGQPSVVSGVVSFSATAFADTLIRDDNEYNQGIIEPNPFLAGKYRLKPYATYSYSTELGQQQSNFDAGTFTLPAFDWQSSARARPAAWLTPALAVKVSPDGEVLVERDPLGVLSTAKFGYGRAQASLPFGNTTTQTISTHALPYLQAHNADPRTIAFESFENVLGVCPTIYGEDYLRLNCVEVAQTSTAKRHTGHFAAQLAALPNAPLANNTWQLTLRALPFTPQVQAAGLLVKVWVFSPGNLSGTLELIDQAEDEAVMGTATLSPVTSNGLIARSGDWVLYSGIALIDAGILPQNYYLTPRLKFTNPASSTGPLSDVWVDDVRVQPADAHMTTYVYDPSTFQLLASFDDQHFGLLYQYNAEGKLTRKQIETERGLKTIQETQYNTAKNP